MNTDDAIISFMAIYNLCDSLIKQSDEMTKLKISNDNRKFICNQHRHIADLKLSVALWLQKDTFA